MPITLSNMSSFNKLLIRPVFRFKSSSRNISVISSANTSIAGLVLEHNFSGLPTNKLLGHRFARSRGFVTKNHKMERNEFSPFTEEFKTRVRDAKNSTPPSSNTPSSLSSSDDDKDSYSDSRTLSHVDSFMILRRQLYEGPEFQRAFDSVMATLLPILQRNLKTVRPDNVTVKSGLETAASIDLLRLVGASSRQLDDIGGRALEGARLLQEGRNKEIDGRRMLERAFVDLPNHL